MTAPRPLRTTRRAILAAASLAALPALAQQRPAQRRAGAQSDFGWYKLTSDEGKPFPNLRIPNELASQTFNLPGLIRAGSDSPDVTLVVFTDYNCPWCRKAAAGLEELVKTDSDLQLGLINNPVLSDASRKAALVELAVVKNYGRKEAYRLHIAALALTGVADAPRTLDLAAAQGLDRALLGKAAADDPELAEALERQMALAASMTFTVTPSFLIGTAGVPGYPGPKAVAGMVANMRRCELIACP